METDRKIVAERSGYIVGAMIFIWLLGIVTLGISVYLLTLTPHWSILFILAVGLFAVSVAIYFSVLAWRIPKSLAYYENGTFYFCPTKHENISVRPSEIRFVSQKITPYLYGTAPVGTMTVELQSGKVVLKWVRDVDYSRRLIEERKASDGTADASQNANA